MPSLRSASLLALALWIACTGCHSKPHEEDAPDWLKHPGPPQRPMSAAESAPYRSCSRDTDCVVALNGCCNCANGGEDIAVNKARREAFAAHFDCSRTHCTEMGAMAPCGSGSVQCVEGLCTYRAPAAR